MDISAHFASSCEADDNNLLIERVGDDYYRELVCESAIDPQVALERAYYRVQHDWPHLVNELGFPKKWFADYWIEPKGCDCHGGELFWPYWAENNQIGLPALVVPRRSPDGERVTYEIKPKTHSFKDDRKYINAPNQELILDIHPRGFKHLQDIDTPVWITEGAKKADSLTSLGLFAINISGVWGFQQKKLYGEDDPVLPCFDYIEWEGRQVILAFDADAMTNQNIQDALARLNGVLQDRGADVLVIQTPAVNGESSAGIDDYLASGGSLRSLWEQAVPYTPIDVSHERLAGYPILREHIESMERYLLEENWVGKSGARSLLKAMVSVARRQGRIVPNPLDKWEEQEGQSPTQCIRIQGSYRFFAEEVGVSKNTVTKNIVALENMGILQRDRTIPRKQRDPMYFILRSDVTRNRYKGMWPPPGSTVRDGYSVDTDRDTDHSCISSSLVVPIPRHPSLRLHNSVPRHGLYRLGKRAEEILDVLFQLSSEALPLDAGNRTMASASLPSEDRHSSALRFQYRSVRLVQGNRRQIRP